MDIFSRNNGGISIPKTNKFDGIVATSAKMSLAFGNFADQALFPLRQLKNKDASFGRGDVLQRNNLPMSTSNRIVEVLFRSNKKLIPIGLSKGFGKGHSIWIGGDKDEHVLTYDSYGVWLGIFFSMWMNERAIGIGIKG